MLKEPADRSLPYRCDYLAGIRTVIENRRKACDYRRAQFITPETCVKQQEVYRAAFVGMLGWPLNCYEALKNTPMAVTKELRGETEDARIYGMTFEVLPALPFYGLFFESKANPVPFVIAQHGGDGYPELASDFRGDNNYHHMTHRALTRHGGANVFAPGLLLWAKASAPADYDRRAIDGELKQLGGSITALEIFAIRRCLDYFIGEGIAKVGHIGMVGLSYGGFYTLMTAASEPRISAAYSSCQYNERHRYPWSDWVWQDSAGHFLDAEIAGLVAPRPLFLEAGDADPLFDAAAFLREAQRAVPFYQAHDAADRLKYRVFAGVHELATDDDGFDFLFHHLTTGNEEPWEKSIY